MNVKGHFRLEGAWPPESPQIADELTQFVRSQAWAVYSGTKLEQLQQQLSRITQQQFAFPCASGSVALELALRGSKIGDGHEVLLSQYDYPGNFRAVQAVGATPRGVGTQFGRWTLDLSQAHHALTPRTKAIVGTHLHGLMCDVSAIKQFADDHDLIFIEDACQAVGGSVDHKPAGSWGDVSLLSFGGSKLLTAGCGGAVLTSDDAISHRIRIQMFAPSPVYAFSEIQAATLLPQLVTLEARHKQRRAAVIRLRGAIMAKQEWALPILRPEDADAGDYKLAWFVPESTRDQVLARGAEMGLPLGSGFSFFKRIAVGDQTNARRAAQELVLLDHRALSARPDQVTTILEILDAIGEPN